MRYELRRPAEHGKAMSHETDAPTQDWPLHPPHRIGSNVHDEQERVHDRVDSKVDIEACHGLYLLLSPHQLALFFHNSPLQSNDRAPEHDLTNSLVI